MCNDAHFLNTGYANYGRPLLNALSNSGKYEVAELACFGKVNDPNDMYANWVYYANHVDSSHPLYEQYISHPQNEFGKWRFERVCLDFRPDVVCVPPDTPVACANNYKRICNIKVGDLVLSHTGHLRRVNKVYMRSHKGQMRKIVLSNETIIKITDEHPILTSKDGENTYNFIQAKQIRAGYIIASMPIVHGQYTKLQVISTSTIYYDGPVYNLEVEHDNSYVIYQSCVHNCDIRDPWMLSFEELSPLRPYYHWIIMPTVDSAPQKPEWLETFNNADAVFTYTDWGIKVLEDESNNSIKTVCAAPPGCDLETFRPVQNKEEHRKRIGFFKDANVIGTIMRTQVRKLYPDLFETFRKFIDICYQNGDTELANNTYLYAHCSYPDVGWEIPDLLLEHELSRKVVFTYICTSCNNVTCSFFKGGRSVCSKCNKASAILPNTVTGLTQQQLAQVLNIFDVYIQYSVCLTPGQQIVTSNGLINIEHIFKGDLVLSHTGKYQRVLKTFKTPYEGDVYRINAHSIDSYLELTPEHPVLVVDKEKVQLKDKTRSIREIIGTRLYYNKNYAIPTIYKQAKDLQISDILVKSIDTQCVDITQFDLANLSNSDHIITKDTIRHKSSRIEHKRYVDIDSEFCKLLGLLIADGHIRNNVISITSHIKDINNHNLFKNIMSKYGNVKEYKNKNRKAIKHYVCYNILSQLIKSWIYLDKHKKMPQFCLCLPDEKKKSLIQGMFMGDGHYRKFKNISMYCTTSPILSKQICSILESLLIPFNLHITKKGGNRKPQYTFEVSGNIKSGDFVTKRTNSRSIYLNGYVLRPIKSISKKHYSGYVYNLEVEHDNTYTHELCTVHNCEGLGIPQLEAASCGVPIMSVDYSAMSDVVRKLKGIPLPVKRMFRDLGTLSYRALPDNDKSAQIIYEFFKKPEAIKRRMGNTARKMVEKYYTWERTVNIWMNYFDNIKLVGKQGQWDSPAPLTINIPPVPENLSNSEFVRWLILNVMKEPKLVNSRFEAKLIADLNYGGYAENRKIVPVTRKSLYKMTYNYAQNKADCDNARLGRLELDNADFIEYAHQRAKYL